MTTPTTHLPEPADETETLALLEDVLGTEPVNDRGRCRNFGAGVHNVAVSYTAEHVCLTVTTERQPGQPARTVTELTMPPTFARYLAANLVAHARHMLTRPADPAA